MKRFYNTSSFNQNIGNWNTSNITDMGFIFSRVAAFNQNVGNRNVSNVQDVTNMFAYESSFNQDLGKWKFKNTVSEMKSMPAYTGLDCSNYSKTLNGWQANNPSLER